MIECRSGAGGLCKIAHNWHIFDEEAEVKASAQGFTLADFVRGRGLFACIELVRDRETREPLIPWTPRGARETHPAVTGTLRALKERGVYAYTKWNMIMLAPPFVIEPSQIEELVHKLETAMQSALINT